MTSRIYLITLKDAPTVPKPVKGGYLVEANSPAQALRAITEGSLDCEAANGLAVAGMMEAGAKIINAVAAEQLPLPHELKTADEQIFSGSTPMPTDDKTDTSEIDREFAEVAARHFR